MVTHQLHLNLVLGLCTENVWFYPWCRRGRHCSRATHPNEKKNSQLKHQKNLLHSSVSSRMLLAFQLQHLPFTDMFWFKHQGRPSITNMHFLVWARFMCTWASSSCTAPMYTLTVPERSTLVSTRNLMNWTFGINHAQIWPGPRVWKHPHICAPILIEFTWTAKPTGETIYPYFSDKGCAVQILS